MCLRLVVNNVKIWKAAIPAVKFFLPPPPPKLEVSYLTSLRTSNVKVPTCPNLFKRIQRSITSLEVDVSKWAVGKSRTQNWQLTFQTLDFSVFCLETYDLTSAVLFRIAGFAFFCLVSSVRL